MSKPTLTQKIDKIVDATARKSRVHGLLLQLSSGDDSFNYAAARGELQLHRPYFIASTTKLYTTARIFQLIDQGRLQRSDRLAAYYSPAEYSGLHLHKGRDYSGDITIEQLLRHSSGLPDYFEDKPKNGTSMLKRLMSGEDMHWDLPKILEVAKGLRPKFAPGTPGKAHYSDTNFQLLGGIIERVTHSSMADNFRQHIFEPLQLADTYLFSDPNDRRPAPMRYRQGQLEVPKAMSSFGPDGGIVSTLTDSMVFLKAFYRGQLFAAHWLEEMAPFNGIMFPIQAGLGTMRVKMPAWLTGFRAMPEIRGHSGLSGAFAFYAPELDRYLVGTVNQIDPPSISFRLMLQLLLAMRQRS